LKSKRTRRPPGSPKRPPWIRPEDAITKLHAIIVFIMTTGQRIDEFMVLAKVTGDDMLHPIAENDTRWFSTYLMLLRAIKLRHTIDLFVIRHRNDPKSGKLLSHFKMTSEDWKYCTEVIAFLKLFYSLVQRLEGKAESGKLSLPIPNIRLNLKTES
jgi:hypothetical protein